MEPPSMVSRRGKGVRRSKRGSRHHQCRPTTRWTPRLTRHFLQAIVEEFEANGWTIGGLSHPAWLRVQDTIFKRTNEWVDNIAVRSRYRVLKSQWRAWVLLTEDRSVTGLGRDPKNGLVTGPDQWWDSMMARNPKIAKWIAKFRYKTLEHENLMEHVYREVTATGNEAYTAGDSNRDHGVAEGFGESVEMNIDGTGPVLPSENTSVTPPSKCKPQSNPNVLTRGGSSGRKRKTSDSSESSSVGQASRGSRRFHDALLKLKALPILSNPDENLDFLFWAIDLLKTSEKDVDILCGLETTDQMTCWLTKVYKEHLMERVYREVTATGNEAYTAVDSNSDHGVAEGFRESVEMNTDGTGPVLPSENTSVTPPIKCKPQSNPNALTRGGSSGRKHKTSDSSESSSVGHASRGSQRFNDALLKLKALPILSNPDENLDFLFWAIDLLKTSEKDVDIFCGLETTDQMTCWLTKEYKEHLMERVYQEVTATGNEAYTAVDSNSDHGVAEGFRESVEMNTDGTGPVLPSENTSVTPPIKCKPQSNPNALMRGGSSGRKRETSDSSESSSFGHASRGSRRFNDAILKLKALPILSNPDENLDFLFWAIDLLKTSEKDVDILCGLETTEQMTCWLTKEYEEHLMERVYREVTATGNEAYTAGDSNSDHGVAEGFRESVEMNTDGNGPVLPSENTSVTPPIKCKPQSNPNALMRGGSSGRKRKTSDSSESSSFGHASRGPRRFNDALLKRKALLY